MDKQTDRQTHNQGLGSGSVVSFSVSATEHCTGGSKNLQSKSSGLWRTEVSPTGSRVKATREVPGGVGEFTDLKVFS